MTANQLNQLNRRVAALEDTAAQSTPRCHVCREWSDLVIRVASSATGGSWPEEPICPNCGRLPLQIVRIGQRSDGPQ